MRQRNEKLERRLEGLKREKAIYEYALDNVGAKIIKTKLMKKFGLTVYQSDAQNFEKSRLEKYTVKYGYPTKQRGHHGNYIIRYKRYIRDIIWLPQHLIEQHMITTIACRNPRWGHKLCYKKTVPFWLLGEYGGPYTGREFITEINKRIKETEEELNGTLY